MLNFEDQLVKAVTNGNLSMVKQMLDYGLNVNYIYDREQNYSFLHLVNLGKIKIQIEKNFNLMLFFLLIKGMSNGSFKSRKVSRLF